MPFLEFVERTSAVFRLSTSSFPFVQPHEGEELVSQPSRQRDGQTYKPDNSNPVAEDLSKSYQATYHEYDHNTINKTLTFVTFKRDHNHSFVSHTFFSLSLSFFSGDNAHHKDLHPGCPDQQFNSSKRARWDRSKRRDGVRTWNTTFVISFPSQALNAVVANKSTEDGIGSTPKSRLSSRPATPSPSKLKRFHSREPPLFLT